MEVRIIAGNSNLAFSHKVAQEAGVPLTKTNISRFADGEVQVEIHESVRGCNCFVIQSTCPPVNHNYMELFLILDALKRASVHQTTAVLPYYGYARQDRKATPRAPISAKAVAQLSHVAGADRLVAIDLHSSQIQGFFDGPVDHLFAIPSLAKTWIQTYGEGSKFVVVSPDSGGVERTRAFAKRINASIAIIDKRRTGPNEAKALHLVGDVKRKTAIIVDDMIDTAGTLTQAVDNLLVNGAEQVFAVATHPVLSGSAISRLVRSPVQKICVTDTIPLSQEAINSEKFCVVSMAPVVAEAIRRIHRCHSISALFSD